MSRENMAAVRAGLEAWNAGDMEAFAEMLAPDVVVHAPKGWPEPGPFVGIEAAMREFGQLRETLHADDLTALDEPVAAGDRVLMRVRWHGVGRGPELTIEWTVLFELRGGKVVLMAYFWDHAEALAAAGLA